MVGVTGPDDGSHGAEGLLIEGRHSRLNAGKHRGCIEEARITDPLAACRHSRATRNRVLEELRLGIPTKNSDPKDVLVLGFRRDSLNN